MTVKEDRPAYPGTMDSIECDWCGNSVDVDIGETSHALMREIVLDAVTIKHMCQACEDVALVWALEQARKQWAI